MYCNIIPTLHSNIVYICFIYYRWWRETVNHWPVEEEQCSSRKAGSTATREQWFTETRVLSDKPRIVNRCVFVTYVIPKVISGNVLRVLPFRSCLEIIYL